MIKKIPSEKGARTPARKRIAKTVSSLPLDQDVQPALETAPLALDYPQARETIVSRHYTQRQTAWESAPSVEVSIDGAAWQPCRFSVGHWWYDWANYDSGKHALRVRAMGPTGRKTIAKRICRVELI